MAFNRQTDEILYFSTKTDLKINGMVYRPSICYKVPVLARIRILEYEKEGKVVIYKTPVRFVNGKVVYPSADQTSAGVVSITREVEVDSKILHKKKGK